MREWVSIPTDSIDVRSKLCNPQVINETLNTGVECTMNNQGMFLPVDREITSWLYITQPLTLGS